MSLANLIDITLETGTFLYEDHFIFAKKKALRRYSEYDSLLDFLTSRNRTKVTLEHTRLCGILEEGILKPGFVATLDSGETIEIISVQRCGLHTKKSPMIQAQPTAEPTGKTSVIVECRGSGWPLQRNMRLVFSRPMT